MAMNTSWENSTVKPALLELLERNRDLYDIEYKGFFSNHLPMGLVALYRMGASEGRLREWFDRYTQRLEKKITSSDSITRNNWKQSIGKKVFYNDYREFFLSELETKHNKFVNQQQTTENQNHKHESIEEKREHMQHLQHHFDGGEESCLGFRGLISHYFPQLMEGLCGSAFHGLILLGYGLELDDANLAVDGLAYLAYSYQSLGSLNSRRDLSNGLELDQVLERLLLTHEKNKEYDREGFNFMDKLAHLAKNEQETLDEFDCIKIDKSSIHRVMDQIIEIGTELYSTTTNFFVLHLITGAHALRQVLPCLSEQDQVMALRYYARAFLSSYIVEGQPALLSQDVDAWKDEIQSTNWGSVVQKAVNDLNDVHDIKLVYTLWQEGEHKFSPLNILVAGHQAGLIAKKEKKYLARAKKPIEVSVHQPSYLSVASGVPQVEPIIPPQPEIHDRKRKKSQGAAIEGQERVEQGQGQPTSSKGQENRLPLSFADAVKENLPEYKQEMKEKMASLKTTTSTSTKDQASTTTTTISDDQVPYGVKKEELLYVIQEAHQQQYQDKEDKQKEKVLDKNREKTTTTSPSPVNTKLTPPSFGNKMSERMNYYWDNYWDYILIGGAFAAGLAFYLQWRR